MSRNTALYVRDILESMRDAQEFVQGLSYEDFGRDKKTFSAVIVHFAYELWYVISEAFYPIL